MKFPRKSTCLDSRHAAGAIAGRARRSGAFSLVELLVAMVVLTLLVLILAQIMGLVSGSWAMGKQRMDNLTKARVFLDLIARDMQDGIFRPDLAAFLDQTGATASMSSTSYAFYTKRTGGGTRPIALLNYKLNATSTTYSLMRGALPVAWSGPPPSFAGLTAGTVGLPELSNFTAGNYSEVASGVVAFRLYFINADTTVSPPTNAYSWNYLPWNYSATGTGKASVAVCVTVAVLDDRTQALLETQSKMGPLSTALNGSMPATLTGSLKDIWDSQINTAGFLSPYPEQVRTGLKVFERVIPLPPYYL
jgi:type II secretory pathway pseudopilin PulG